MFRINYLRPLCCFIELNPVRAAMVAQPEDYPWSSVRTHLGTAQDPLVVPHPVYMGLGKSPDVRAAAWRQWLHAPLDPDEISRIRAYMAQERALGEPHFQAMVEKALNRPAAVRPRGRPVRAGEVDGRSD
jgi:putative transposase